MSKRVAPSKAAHAKAAVSFSLAAALIGTGFVLGADPAGAADTSYKAAVDRCRANDAGAAALRDCLQANAPQRAPKIAKPSASSTRSSSSARSSSARSSKTTSGGSNRSSTAAPAPAPSSGSGSGSSGGVWAQLRDCEAGGDYGLNDGSGYYGAYQFDLSTWHGLGYSGYPNQASPEVQDEAARVLQSQRGWQPWPACSRKLGLR